MELPGDGGGTTSGRLALAGEAAQAESSSRDMDSQSELGGDSYEGLSDDFGDQ